MRAVIQRVSDASIRINGGRPQSMGRGLVVLFGVCEGDDPRDTLKLADKIAGMRIFEDREGKMNLSCLDIGGSCMVVSQFTLFADTKKGRRPSFIKAAHPDFSKPVYEKFLEEMSRMGFEQTLHGEFGAHMDINLTNDGPVTIIIDTQQWRNQQ